MEVLTAEARAGEGEGRGRKAKRSELTLNVQKEFHSFSMKQYYRRNFKICPLKYAGHYFKLD